MEHKIHFDIKKYDGLDSLQQIHNVTRGFQINMFFLANMTEAIYKRKHTWFGSIDAPPDVDLIKQIIGKNGFHLKQFTVKYGADLIWHDRVTNKFMVWGAKKVLINTLYALVRQIGRFVINHCIIKSPTKSAVNSSKGNSYQALEKCDGVKKEQMLQDVMKLEDCLTMLEVDVDDNTLEAEYQEIYTNCMGPNEMGPNEMGPNEMGANEMGANEMGANEMGPILTTGQYKQYRDRLEDNSVDEEPLAKKIKYTL
jgi:hypothetical protein